MNPFTIMVAVRPEQKAPIHLTRDSGMPVAPSLWSSLSLKTPLYGPLDIEAGQGEHFPSSPCLVDLFLQYQEGLLGRPSFPSSKVVGGYKARHFHSIG